MSGINQGMPGPPDPPGPPGPAGGNGQRYPYRHPGHRASRGTIIIKVRIKTTTTSLAVRNKDFIVGESAFLELVRGIGDDVYFATCPCYRVVVNEETDIRAPIIYKFPRFWITYILLFLILSVLTWIGCLEL
ncbi:hypothetical protein V6N13_060748 [Hibiscus sabdariffa]|uniref:Uncharacterized protein n=1 Tax=Hibiscus sabdariffa TaxID=183260 RepID=A0ABR2P771_9ROSI